MSIVLAIKRAFLAQAARLFSWLEAFGSFDCSKVVPLSMQILISGPASKAEPPRPKPVHREEPPPPLPEPEEKKKKKKK